MFNNKLSKYNVKKIIECFCIDIEASKTALLLKINRNTINRYYGLFRSSIFEYQTQKFQKIIGVVELDESYFGPKRARGVPTKRGRGTHKQPVFGIFERDGCVYTEIIPNCKKRILLPIIVGKVDSKSIINTDGWRGYDGLVDVGYDKHFCINHDKEFSNSKTHINGIESFWSFTKRRLSKFNGYKTNFHLHLKECEWRWNKNSNDLFKELNKLFFTKF